MNAYEAKNIVKTWNNKRRANKDKWIFMDIIGPDLYLVQIKSYNTWIQIIQYKGRKDGGPMDCRVKDANEFLTNFLREL